MSASKYVENFESTKPATWEYNLYRCTSADLMITVSSCNLINIGAILIDKINAGYAYVRLNQ